MRRPGKQTTIGDALTKVVGRIDGGSVRLKQVRVFDAWQVVAGPTVTAHTRGAHLRAGELVVEVDSAVWATELSALAGHYQEAMEERLGKGVVRTVRFSVSRRVEQERVSQGHAAQEDGFYTQDVVKSIPLTPQERAQVEASAAAIPHEDLRTAVIKATVADLEWKKGLAARKEPQKPSGSA